MSNRNLNKPAQFLSKFTKPAQFADRKKRQIIPVRRLAGWGRPDAAAADKRTEIPRASARNDGPIDTARARATLRHQSLDAEKNDATPRSGAGSDDVKTNVVRDNRGGVRRITDPIGGTRSHEQRHFMHHTRHGQPPNAADGPDARTRDCFAYLFPFIIKETVELEDTKQHL